MNEPTSPFNVTTDDHSHWRTGPDIAASMLNDLKRELKRLSDGDRAKHEWEATQRTYTIKQAAAKTGLLPHVIYKKICDGDIQARMAPIGALRWLISAPEVMKLMPDPSTSQATPCQLVPRSD